MLDGSTADRFEEAFSLNEGKVDLQFLEGCKRFLELVMLRRTKESSGIGLELPPKTEIALSVPLSRFQHASYLNILTGVDQLLDKPDSSAPVDNNLVSRVQVTVKAEVQNSSPVQLTDRKTAESTEENDHGQPPNGASKGIDPSISS